MKSWVALLVVLLGTNVVAQQRAFIGMDRNGYPGDAQLRDLGKRFAFTGYWLNNPPGTSSNSWAGHRKDVVRAGMGFLVLWNGRTFQQLGSTPEQLGRDDAKAAVDAARKEGFPRGTVIFLDQEEGGRLLAPQRAYLHAWVDGVTAAGYRAGVYCSGIAYTEGSGATVVTAEDIRANAGTRKIVFWVSNDNCPPSPGCRAKVKAKPADSGVKFADIWQYSQSPMRTNAGACKQTYDPTMKCYAPGTKIDVDMNVATTRDPSRGR